MAEPLSVMLARTLLAQFFVAGAAFSAYVLASLAMRGEPRLARWTGVVVVGSFLATLGFHLLTALHAFAWAPAAGGVALLSVLARALERRSGAARQAWSGDLRFVRRSFARWRRHPWQPVSLLTLAVFLPAVLRPMVAPILSWDGLTYHGLKAAIPVQTGAAARLWAPGQWSYAGPMWGGHEALASWAMLPFHTDLLSTFAEVVQFGALGLALFGLAREARVQEPLGSLCAAAVLSIPTFLLRVGSAQVEIGAMMALAAALLLLVRALRARRPGPLLLSAAALGVCTGMKINMLSLSAPLSLAIVFAGLRLPSSPRVRALWVTLAAGAFIACIAPWLVYGTQVAGAPLAPLPVKLAGLQLGVAPPELAAYMQRDGLTSGIAVELATLGTIFGSGPVDARLGPYCAGLLMLGLVGCARVARRRPELALLSLLVAALAVLAYYAPGLLVLRRVWTISSCRFLMPVAVALGPLAAHGIPARAGWGKAAAAALAMSCVLSAVPCLNVGVQDGSLHGMGRVALCVPLLVATWWLARRWERVFPLVVVLSMSGALVGLQGLRNQLRPGLMASEYQLVDVPRYWALAARLCDMPSARPRRIAITSGPAQNLDNLYTFAFLGSALQNELTYVTPARDGRIHHFGSAADNARFAASLDRDAWLERLAERGITHVMSFKSKSAELAWMESLPSRFQKLDGASNWGFYAVITQRRASVREPRLHDGDQR